MPRYKFPAQVARNRAGGLVQTGALAAYAVDDLTFSTPLTIYNLDNATVPAVNVTDFVTDDFQVDDHPEVYLKSGAAPAVFVASTTGMRDEVAAAAADAADAAARAETAEASANAAANLVDAPADAAVAAVVTPGSGSQTETVLNGTYVTHPESLIGGAAGFAYGDSWTYPNYSAVPYPEQYDDLLGLASMDNRGVSGLRIQNVSAYVQSAASAEPWVPGTSGVVSVGALLNSQVEGDTTANRETARESLRATVARLTAATYYPATDATKFAYTPAWIAWTNTFSINGEARYTNPTLAADAISTHLLTVTAPAGVNYLSFIGLAAVTGKGATMVLYDNADVELSRTVLDERSVTTPGGIGTGARSHVVTRIPGTAGGTFKVRLTTPAGFAGQVFGFFDGMYTLAAEPPMVVLVKPVPVGHASYQKPALETFLRGLPDEVAAEFPGVVVADPLPGWDKVAMLGDDLLHPNATGQAHLARAVRNAVNGAVMRAAARVSLPGLF